jgi:hypothetical protein
METHVPTFGFSAFLKLISLNSRPQLTEIRNRSKPSTGGYDFHKSLRRLGNQLIVDEEPLADLLREAQRIASAPERESAKTGLKRLRAWRASNPGRILQFDSVVYESPAKNFKVKYESDFGIELGGSAVAVHIWNTGKPELDERMTYAALSLLPSLYAAVGSKPDDVAVLSLPENRLYRLSEVGDYTEVAIRMVGRLDDLFERVRGEPPRTTRTPRERPAPPPPLK